MTRRYYIFILVLLVALTALGDRYLPTFQTVSPEPTAKTKASDFYLENVRSTVMLKDGKPEYTLEAERISHFPDEDTVELKQVKFKLFRPAQSKWSGRAQQGRVDNRKGIIHLKGKVVLQRPASKTAEAIKLSTPELHIYSKKDYAETTAAVQVESGNNKISATGMRLYLEDGRMEFLSSTRVIYHAPRK